MANTWLSVYSKKINAILFDLEKHAMMNTGGGLLNLRQIASFLKGALEEIRKQDVQIRNLEEEISRLKTTMCSCRGDEVCDGCEKEE